MPGLPVQQARLKQQAPGILKTALKEIFQQAPKAQSPPERIFSLQEIRRVAVLKMPFVEMVISF